MPLHDSVPALRTPAGTPPSWLAPASEPDLVSVIIPTYNRAKLISYALDSLDAQTWPRLEIVVVDDGSTDHTLEVLQALPPLRAGRSLRILTQPNAGVSAARNTGTRAATGEFILYLDSDDVLFPEAITRYVKALREHGAPYCFAPIDTVDESGTLTNDHRRYYPRFAAADPLFDCFWLVHGACYRREVLDRAGPWNPELRRAEDHELFWRIKTSSGLGHHLNVVQGTYRQHSRDQLHHQIDKIEFFEIRVESLDHFCAWLRQTGRLDRAMRLCVAGQYRFLATRLAALGRLDSKNRALDQVSELCRGFWHPLRLSTLLRHVNASWFFEYTARAKYRWSRLSSRQAPGPAAQTSSRPTVLFISPLFPDREGSGPARRAESVITALSREHQVTLLVVSTLAHRDSSPVPADYLGGRWGHVPFKRPRWHHLRKGIERRFPRLHGLLWRNPVDWTGLTPACFRAARLVFDGQRFDRVHAFRLIMAPCALAMRDHQPAGTRFHLDLDDFESHAIRQRSEQLKFQADPRLAESSACRARAYERAERSLLRRLDRLYVCSEIDRRKLASACADVCVLPNIAPLPATQPPPPPAPDEAAEGFRFLFVGALNYPPNTDAVAWFCHDMLPHIQAARTCTFVLGGRQIPAELRLIVDAAPRTRFIGEFKTAAEVFGQAHALVVPLRAGAGTRIKILEAFTYRRPVISTTIGIAGIEAVPERDFLLADTPDEFIRQSIRLAGDQELGRRLAANASQLVEERYSLKVMIQALAADHEVATGAQKA